MRQFIGKYGAVFILAFIIIVPRALGLLIERDDRIQFYKNTILLFMAIGLMAFSAIEHLTGLAVLGPYYAICVLLVIAMYIYIAIYKRRNRKK